MQTVSQRWLDSLPKPHRVLTAITATPYGGTPQTLRVQSASVSVDSRARIRRRLDLTVLGTKALFDVCGAPGTVFNATTGFDYGSGQSEVLPVFQGRTTKGGQIYRDGVLNLTLVDWGDWIAQSRLLAPFSPALTTARTAIIAQTITDAKPGTTVTNLSSDIGSVTSARVWNRDRGDIITDLTSDGMTEAFFAPDGSFIIRDQPTLANTSPVFYFRGNSGGTLKTAERQRPLDKLYNTVVVTPSSSDGSQTWTQQVAQITDPKHPWHPNKVGVVPYFYASPTAPDAGTAYNIALTMLDKVQGNAETVSIDAVGNPALEGGDVIGVAVPALGTDQAQLFRHYIDSYQLDLLSHDMSLSTRAVKIENEAGSQ